MRIINAIIRSGLVRTAVALAKIARRPLPPEIKRRVCKARLALGLQRESAGGRCRILGHTMTGPSVEELTFLFDEIFVDLAYYFVTANPRPFILDGGANAGMATLFFKTLYPGATIVGFEPAPESFARLSGNVQGNQFDHVTVHPFALGETTAQVTLFQGASSLMASTDPMRASTKAVQTSQVRLSDYVDREVDFLKLDVEGAEMGVLRELAASGRIRSIARMVVEYHHHVDPKRDELSALAALLEQAGFGYQIEARRSKVKLSGCFQDILVYAYRKDPPPP